MKKLVKLPLPINGILCKSIEDLKENFNIYDLLEHFESGKLEIWLKSRKFEQISAIQEISKLLSKTTVSKKIYEAFDLEFDANETFNAIVILEYTNKYKERKFKLDKIKNIVISHKNELLLESTNKINSSDRNNEENKLFKIELSKIVDAHFGGIVEGKKRDKDAELAILVARLKNFLQSL
jgi:hypothetical protein